MQPPKKSIAALSYLAELNPYVAMSTLVVLGSPDSPVKSIIMAYLDTLDTDNRPANILFEPLKHFLNLQGITPAPRSVGLVYPYHPALRAASADLNLLHSATDKETVLASATCLITIASKLYSEEHDDLPFAASWASLIGELTFLSLFNHETGVNQFSQTQCYARFKALRAAQFADMEDA